MPQDSEIKQLHETVKKAINLWVKTQPSVAEAKAKEDEEKRLTEDKKDNIEKEKKQTSKRLKISTLIFSMSKGVVSGAKNTFDNIRQSFSRATSFVVSHVREVLGPVAEAFDFVKNIFMGVFENIKKVFMLIWGVPKWAGKQIKLLGEMVAYFHREEKRKALDMNDPKQKKRASGMFAFIIGAIVAVIGTAVGFVIRKIFLPLEMIFRMFRWRARLRLLRMNIARRFPQFMESMNKFFKLFSKTGKIGRMFATILTKVPLLAKFLSFVGKGMIKFFWPIQIVLSIIDFIKGFMKTEGTFIDKLKGGLYNVVWGLVGWLIEFPAWIIEKILNKVGVDIQPGTIAENVKKGFFKILDLSPIGLVFRIAKWLETGKFEYMYKDIVETITDIGNAVKGFFSGVWEKVKNKWKSWFPDDVDADIPDEFGTKEAPKKSWSFWPFGKKEEEPERVDYPTDLSPVSRELSTEYIRRAARSEVYTPEDTKMLKNSIDNLSNQVSNLSKRSGGDINKKYNVAMAGRREGGIRTEAKQIPDEIDNNIVTVRNLSMAMGD